MTQFMNKTFRSPANSRAFVDNWTNVFGPKEDEASAPPQDASHEKQTEPKKAKTSKK